MKNPLYWCFVIALAGCSASLYYGEILGVEPCSLCWYQRIALFPLALILGMGLFRGDKHAASYAFPLSIFGFAVGLVQAIDLHFPHLRICSKECAKATFSIFGFVTFPDLSVIGFGLIAILLFVYYFGKGKSYG